MKHLFHLSRVWGSRHGGSAYSQAIVKELLERGWEATLLAEEFMVTVGTAEQVRLTAFFRRELRALPRRAKEVIYLWWKVARTPGAFVIVQGDLPRLTYVLLQLAVPLVFVRQDGVLTCPGNNRFLRRSRSVCRRQMGLSCFAVNRAEGCMAGLSFWKQVGRLMFRTRDRLLLRCVRHFVTNSCYLVRVHRRAGQVLYPPLSGTEQLDTDGDRLPKYRAENPGQSQIRGGQGRAAGLDDGGRPWRAPLSWEGRDLGRLVFCGRLEPVKGAGDAITILGMLPQRFCLEILGEGIERGRLGQLVDQLGVRSRVKFSGWVDGATRDRALSMAGVLLMPSLWDEAFGMAGTEALTQGTPVVAYDVGGISEWCRDGAGVLVPCGDVKRAARAVQELTADPGRWAVHSRAARRVAELEFSGGRFARDLDGLLGKIQLPNNQSRVDAEVCKQGTAARKGAVR